MTEMPTPKAERYFNVREGLEAPFSRYVRGHTLETPVVYVDLDLEKSNYEPRDGASRLVGGSALVGAEISSAS